MIASKGKNSGVSLQCEKACVVLNALNWEINLQQLHDCIVFIDEGDPFIKSKDFARAVKNSDNYYVIASRASLFELPYSINEVYEIKNKSANRYQGTKRIYSEFYPLHKVDIEKISKPELL